MTQELKENELYVKFDVVSNDGKTLKFEGPVSLVGLREWFDRSATGILTVFELQSTELRCVNSGPNKILAIKITRDELNTSLRDAKDFIEGARRLQATSSFQARRLIESLAKVKCIATLGN